MIGPTPSARTARDCPPRDRGPRDRASGLRRACLGLAIAAGALAWSTVASAWAQAAPGAERAVAEKWIGVVLPLEAIDVAAQVGGRIEEIRVRAGQEVAAGDLLVRLDERQLLQDRRIAEADLAMAEAELERAVARTRQEASRRDRRSTTPDLWSEEELSAAEVEARSAEADAEAARARVTRSRASVEQLGQVLDQTEIRAPFAGHVSIRYLDPGTFVTAGRALVRLVSSEALLVRFAVPPEEVERLRVGAEVLIEESGDRPTLRALGRARVRHISPEIDLASQRIFVEAILDPASLDRPTKGGLGVEVRLPAATAAGAR